MSMASTEKELLKWLENRNEATQARVFRKWFLWKLKTVHGRDESDEVYQKLAGPNGINTTKPTEDLKESLKDGTLLCRLAEIFTRKTIIKGGATAWFENPSNSDEAIKNISVGLGHFVADGVAVAGSDPKILHSGVKMMKEWFAVLWTIIMRYQIEVGQDTLLKFLAESCLPQGVVVNDLLASWLDGRAFAALATRFKPGLFAQGSLETKGQHRREDLLGPAFKAGEESGIPALLDAALDFGDHTSDRVVTLYAYQYYDTFGPPADLRALKKKAAELAQTVVERDQQLARSATELRYLVNSHQEVRGLLEDQRGAMREANRKVMELSLKLPFYTGGGYKQKIPPPDEGNITLVMTAVYNSNILWDTVPEAMAQALRIHNRLLLDSIEEFEGYGANMDGGTFTIAFADPVNALKFSNKIQRDLLETDWPEELLAAPDAAPQYADPETKTKLLFNGLRVKIAIHHGEPLCHQDAFGRATYSGSEVSLTSSLLCVTNPGQIVISGAALKAIREELGQTTAEPGTESEVSEQLSRISLGKDIEGVNQELETRALGDVKITAEESTSIFSVLPLDLMERSEHFKVIEFSDADLVDVRSILLGKVEELQLQNQKLKDRLADMEQKASTATRRANELQQWLSSCVATPVVSTEETLRDAKENLRRIMEEHHDLKDTLVMVKKQNDHLQGVLKQLAAELRETSFDQKMTSNQLNQITRLHKTCPTTIHALRKERDELLKKLGKNKGFLNKLMTKVGIKKEEAVVASTTTEEQTEEEAVSEATDAQEPKESKEPGEPTSTPGEASEGTPSEAETVTTKPAENAEPSEKPENDAVAAPSEPPKEAAPNAEEAGSSKPRLHRTRSSRSASSRKLKKQESVSAVDGGKKKHREGKSERDKTPEAKAEREKERAERKKRKAERAERKARAAAEAAASGAPEGTTTPPAEQPTA